MSGIIPVTYVIDFSLLVTRIVIKYSIILFFVFLFLVIKENPKRGWTFLIMI